MSKKGGRSKGFVLTMIIIVVLIIVIGFWLTWKIVEDGMNKNAFENKSFLIDKSETQPKKMLDIHDQILS